MGNKNKLLKLTLLLSSMMTMMAGAVVSPALPQINTNFGHIENADLLVRLIITIPALPVVFFSPLAGFIIDRFGRKMVLISSLIIYCIGGCSGFFLNDLYLILGGRLLLGVAISGIMTVSSTLVGDYFKGDERNRFMGVQGSFIGFGGVFFISLSGWLTDIEWRMPFLIYAFSIPVLFMVLAFLFEPEVSEYDSEVSSGGKLPVGKIVLILFLVFTGIVYFYLMPVQMPYYLAKMEGTTNTMTGLAISFSTLMSSIVAYYYGRIKKRLIYPFIYALAFAFMGLGYFAESLSTSYIEAIISLVLVGGGAGLLMPSGNLWMMSITAPAMRGRMVSLVSSFTFLGMFMSPIIAQPLIDRHEVAGAFQISALILIILSSLLLIFGIRG